MTGTHGIYVDPDTDQIKLKIIRDTDQELIVDHNNRLNSYCDDLKTFLVTHNAEERRTVAKPVPTIYSHCTVGKNGCFSSGSGLQNLISERKETNTRNAKMMLSPSYPVYKPTSVATSQVHNSLVHTPT